MKKERQHFVPKAYLKNFSLEPSNEVYRSIFIPNKGIWYKPKLVHISSICYSFDFYDVHKKFADVNNINPDYIERKAFWYEKDFINKIILGIRSGKLESGIVEKIPDFYLSMIVRNPKFRDALDQNAIDELIKKQISIVKKKIEKHHQNIESLIHQDFYRKIKEAEMQMYSEYTKSFGHNNTIFRQHIGESADFNNLLLKLKGYKIMFVKISNAKYFFITSNFPGFSIDSNNQITTFKFKDDVCHCMPISSKETLVLLHPVYNITNHNISTIEATEEFISFINQNTLLASNFEIYSQDLVTLENIIKVNNSKQA